MSPINELGEQVTVSNWTVPTDLPTVSNWAEEKVRQGFGHNAMGFGHGYFGHNWKKETYLGA